jgi:hypothetical protein
MIFTVIPDRKAITTGQCRYWNIFLCPRDKLNKKRQDKTRQDKTRQDKTRQDKTRQEKGSIDNIDLNSLEVLSSSWKRRKRLWWQNPGRIWSTWSDRKPNCKLESGEVGMQMSKPSTQSSTRPTGNTPCCLPVVYFLTARQLRTDSTQQKVLLESSQ